MRDVNIDISFKQTTSNWVKCRKCGDSVCGEDGYMKINFSFGKWTAIDKRIVFCMDCWGEYFEEIEKAKINKTKTYENLVKLGILKGLE